MKKIVTLLGFMSAGLFTMAQSVEDGHRNLYYERYQSAADNFEPLWKQQGNAEALYGLTIALLAQEQTEQARSVVNNATQAAVQEQPYYKLALGTLLLYEGKTTEAHSNFQQALEETKEKDPAILSAVAKAHIDAKNGDPNYAIELLQKAIKRDKKNAMLHVYLGDAYRKMNNGSEAYKAYKKAIEDDASLAVAYHRIGEIFLTQKNADLYLDYFNQAVQADPQYAPSLYKQYAYYFYTDPKRALDIYRQYAQRSDSSIQHEYDWADLLYLNKQYDAAIAKANAILENKEHIVKPRIHKLISYSYAGLKDTAKAISHMQKYFNQEQDSNLIAKDFESMGDFYLVHDSGMQSAMSFYAKAAEREKDSAKLYNHYKKLAILAGQLKDYPAQAGWLQKYYTGNDKANNVDLFNWALSHYRAENYHMADSVFGIYTEKYPEQSFGFYWRARSNMAMDKEMEKGTALPHYQKLIEVLSNNPNDTNYKKWMVEAYAYLAAYEANTEKDYKEAITYFEKVLEVDPQNESARKYIDTLEKSQKD